MRVPAPIPRYSALKKTKGESVLDSTARLRRAARERADDEARRIPWQQLYDARNQYIDWQEFYLWVRNGAVGCGELSGATLTGNSLAPSPPPSRPALYRLHQLKTRLALTPCARATSATDAPSANVASTIRRFSSNDRYCRFGVTG